MNRQEQYHHQEEYRREGLSFKAYVQMIGAVLFVVLLAVFLKLAWATLQAFGPLIALTIVAAFLVVVPGALVLGAYVVISNQKNKAISARRFAANANNAYSVYLDDKNGRFIQAINGPQPEQVPAHYSPTIHTQNDVKDFVKLLEYSQSTKVQEIAPPASADLHIPSFRESLELGLIGPGQTKMLLCHELVQDEETGETIAIEPYQGEIEDNSTLFLGGSSKSGKSTYMAHLAAQGALMNALYYVIDPHLTHPEKSVAKKIESLSHAFILPPARTEAEIWQVLNHAKAIAEARKDGRETPYGDRPIIFILDEALAVLGQAHHTQNKEVILMYRDLALFLRDLGTQYAKFGVSGVIASQYVTKDAFKLPPPAGNVDFRDGCQNQILMRLPANQAQAMRLIDAKQLRGVRQLPQGHGYMGLYTGDLLRMASGNVSRQDIEYVASLAQPSPDLKKQVVVPTQYPTGTRSVQSSAQVIEHNDGVSGHHHNGAIPSSSQERHPSTGPLASGVKSLVAQSEQGTTPGTEGTTGFKKRFTPEQEIQFLTLHREHKSIKIAIAKMHISYGDYQAYASHVVQKQRGR